MPKLIFYRQMRYDGGLRTGVELDGGTIAETYEGQGTEIDPSLLWYIDLRCEGEGLPNDFGDPERWLLEHSGVIRDGFARYAEHLRAGADIDVYSLLWSDFKGVPAGVTMSIACSAVRRVDARQMATYLKDVAENWEAIVKSMFTPQEVEGLR